MNNRRSSLQQRLADGRGFSTHKHALAMLLLGPWASQVGSPRMIQNTSFTGSSRDLVPLSRYAEMSACPLAPNKSRP